MAGAVPKSTNLLSSKYPSSSACCPFGHSLILRDPAELVPPESWRCDGAIYPGQCVCDETKEPNTADPDHIKSGGLAGDPKGIHRSNNTDGEEGVGACDNDDDGTLVESAASSNSCALNGRDQRYRCQENCDFDLCGVCYRLLSDKTDDGNGETDKTYFALEPAVEELILDLRRWSLQNQSPIPNFPPNAYKRAVHASGCVDTEQRLMWLAKQFLQYNADVNAPLFVAGDIYNEILFHELSSICAEFSSDARKKALFHSGNTDVELARSWLMENARDPLLDSPIRFDNKARRCPLGHELVMDDVSTPRRWICDGEDRTGVCRRGVTTENYGRNNSVQRYMCKMDGCEYSLCDDCVIKLVPRLNTIASDAIRDVLDAKELKQSEETVGEDGVSKQEENFYAVVDVSKGENKETLATTGNDWNGRQKETFQFVDLNRSDSVDDNIQHFDDYTPWAEAIVRATRDAKVVSHRTFKTPLKSLPGGRSLMNAKLPGKDHGLHHRYIVLGLKDPDDHVSFLSMEKGQSGIVVQMHNEFDEVAKRYMGNDRDAEDPNEIESKDLTGIHRLNYVHLPSIAKLLRNWTILARYDLFGSNCQTLAGDVRNRVIQASNGLDLHLPGTSERAKISDSKALLTYFENRFPGWRKKTLIRVPELQASYAISIQTDGKRAEVLAACDATEVTEKEIHEKKIEEEYDQLFVKQKGLEGVYKALSGKAFANDTKALFYQLTQKRSAEALKGAGVERDGVGNLEKSLSEIVAQFWRENFEFMAITSRHGIMIFDYHNDEQGVESEESMMQNRADALREFGHLPEPCITTILIHVNPEPRDPSVSEPREMSYGSHFTIYVSKSLITHDVKFCLKKIATRIFGKIPKKLKLKRALENLTVKLTVLQNLENETHLVHHKLDHQEWGRTGVMLWTKAQKACIEEGRRAFSENGKPLRLIIRGCQGSGKTLVLLRLAKEFVNRQTAGSFLICVSPGYFQLKGELRDHVRRDEQMAGRVLIGNFVPSLNSLFWEMAEDEEMTNSDFIMHEKRYHHIETSAIGAFCMDEAALDASLNAVADLHVKILRLLPTQHIIMATSQKDFIANTLNDSCGKAQLDHRFWEVMLEGNLRSSPSISELTTNFQMQVADFKNTNILVKSALEFASPLPKVTIVDSADRIEFVERVVGEVRGLLSECGNADVRVFHVCHLSLVDEFRKKLKKDEKRISFSTPSAALGCQFLVVVLAIDLGSTRIPLQRITDALTRATTGVRCVVNASTSTLMINDRPSFCSTQRNLRDIPPFFLELTSTCDGTVVVSDSHNLLPGTMRSMLEAMDRVEFTEEFSEIQGATRNAAIVLALVPQNVITKFNLESYAPVIELVVGSNINEDRCRDLDHAWTKPLIKFFKHYSLKN